MQKKEDKKEKSIRFHKILKLMESIIINHAEDTVLLPGGKKVLHPFFHKKRYNLNPLERIYFSEDIFSKKGCYEFLKILKLMEIKGIKKETKKILNEKEKEKIFSEYRELKELLKNFKKNPDINSPYIQDRIMAKEFR